LTRGNVESGCGSNLPVCTFRAPRQPSFVLTLSVSPIGSKYGNDFQSISALAVAPPHTVKSAPATPRTTNARRIGRF
jgi:hypothetical protein